MEQHINITLRLRERDVDIRIPRRIEVRRLVREVDTICLLYTSPSPRDRG